MSDSVDVQQSLCNVIHLRNWTQEEWCMWLNDQITSCPVLNDYPSIINDLYPIMINTFDQLVSDKGTEFPFKMFNNNPKDKSVAQTASNAWRDAYTKTIKKSATESPLCSFSEFKINRLAHNIRRYIQHNGQELVERYKQEEQQRLQLIEKQRHETEIQQQLQQLQREIEQEHNNRRNIGEYNNIEQCHFCNEKQRII